MTPEQREKRKRIMQRSIALGHCVCDPKKPCPCPLFREKDVCECAGERLPVREGPVRLTECVRGAGCASKIGRKALQEALSSLPPVKDERVLVGSATGDDAGVIRLGEGADSVLTVDVFAPAVDDPYLFGQIAAANSVSDIYAMGATPQAALSIIGFPIYSLPSSAMAEILKGGVDTMNEAGVPVVGGHSINDEEVKCGFAVLGTSAPGAYITNVGARPGDAIVLTKPLGNGLIAFAGQIGRATDESLTAAAESMRTLNRVAGEALHAHGCHAATDVTGYSLLGHLSEVVRQSGVAVALDFDSLPLFPGVQALAVADVLPGAVERNREAVSPDLLDLSALTEAQEAVLYSPETSGGLLAFLPQDRAEAYVQFLQSEGIAAATVIGQVVEEHEGGLVTVSTQKPCAWKSTESPSAAPNVSDAPPTSSEPVACCGGASETTSSPASADTGGCCASSPAEEERGFLPPLPEAATAAFTAYQQAVNAPGALGAKEKKLIALALSVATKCEPCVKINARAAKAQGASVAEVAEAAAMGVSFGGASVNMFYNRLRDALA
ncbi:MAG: selenide, water dikinase SelD [Planctomycetota bacterium]|jgi:selenide,water dikinase